MFTVNVRQVYFYFIQSQSYAGEPCTNPDFLLFYGQSDSSVNEENGHQQQVSSGGGQQSPGWADVPPLLIREPFKPASCSDSCPFLSYAVRAADSRMKTLMVQKPPPPLSLLFRTGKQSDLRLITLLLSIDCAALPSSVPRREKWHKHFDSYLYLFSSPWRAEE